MCGSGGLGDAKGKCIPMRWTCDGEPDCDDRSDEHEKICGRLLLWGFHGKKNSKNSTIWKQLLFQQKIYNLDAVVIFSEHILFSSPVPSFNVVGEILKSGFLG